MTRRHFSNEDTMHNHTRTATTTDTPPSTPPSINDRAYDDDRRVRSCAIGKFGVAAMAVALVVTSLMTLAAEAQMPSTTPGVDGDTSGTNSSSGAGLYVFAVVMALIVGGAIVLYLRHRKSTP